ncbi:glycosyltransferase [Rhodococcoides yunnanense]|uniref:glycosyltransferase n=1 Tax=Rhodococcoides yunnanense TaxID=278209 RepID=UPI0009349A85|nr:glycosyltransferase [Rhodococcus yunnanensis]
MRILHIVTLISDDGAYGGPTRVAVNQAEGLAARGHEVTIAAAGVSGAPASDSVRFELFRPRTVIPRSGFAGLSAPSMLRWITKVGREFDVVHVHLARDLVTLPAARLCQALGIDVVVQTHGMIDATDKVLARPLDAALTRPVLRRAAHVFYLTDREQAELRGVAGPMRGVGGPLRLRRLTNGVPELAARVEDGRLDVLFLARLHPRKRADLFAAMAKVMVTEYPSVSFTLVGPDEGGAPAPDPQCPVRWEGPLPPDRTADRMRAAAVYVLPAMDEPYPMSVLEAMAVGLPVIISDSCGLAPDVIAAGCGIVFETGNLVQLIEAVRLLLSNAELRLSMGARGRSAARARFGTAAIADALESFYDGTVQYA